MDMAKGLQTKEKIINAAVRLARRNGLHGLTIGELAKVVGMSKSGLFAHFNSKDNLQLKVLEKAAKDFSLEVFSKAFKEPKGEPRLRAIFHNWLQYLEDSSALPGSDLLIAASTELNEQPGPLRDFAQNTQRALIQTLKRAVEISIEEGHLRKDVDSEAFAWSLYSFVLGYYHFKRLLLDPRSIEYANQSFEGLLKASHALGTSPLSTINGGEK